MLETELQEVVGVVRAQLVGLMDGMKSGGLMEGHSWLEEAAAVEEVGHSETHGGDTVFCKSMLLQQPCGWPDWRDRFAAVEAERASDDVRLKVATFYITSRPSDSGHCALSMYPLSLVLTCCCDMLCFSSAATPTSGGTAAARHDAFVAAAGASRGV